jgi:hypothetical protein
MTSKPLMVPLALDSIAEDGPTSEGGSLFDVVLIDFGNAVLLPLQQYSAWPLAPRTRA